MSELVTQYRVEIKRPPLHPGGDEGPWIGWTTVTTYRDVAEAQLAELWAGVPTGLEVRLASRQISTWGPVSDLPDALTAERLAQMVHEWDLAINGDQDCNGDGDCEVIGRRLAQAMEEEVARRATRS